MLKKRGFFYTTGRSCAISTEWASPAAKEVARYREALMQGFERMRDQQGILGNSTLVALFQLLKNSSESFRTQGRTVLKNERSGATVFVPPQDSAQIQSHMQALERFINDDELSPLDSIIKMALIHHQFESIHPFSDGNGRIGRILCVLYLVRSGLLDTPVLYLSRYINRNKPDYYRLLQSVRDASGDEQASSWQAWVKFMLNAVADTAQRTVQLVRGMRTLMADTKRRMRDELPKLYSQDLLNNLFRHPYTRIEFVQNDLGVTRPTATRYLRQLAQAGLVQEHSQGKHIYFINVPLIQLLTQGERA